MADPITHGNLAGLSSDDHLQYIKHSLATAANDFLVASGAGVFVKKTLTEIKTLLGLGTAAYVDIDTTAADITMNGTRRPEALEKSPMPGTFTRLIPRGPRSRTRTQKRISPTSPRTLQPRQPTAPSSTRRPQPRSTL